MAQWLWLSNFSLHNYFENKIPFSLHNFLQNSLKKYFKLSFFISFFENIYIFLNLSNSLICPNTKSATHCLTELLPIYENKHWTIRRRDDHIVVPSSNCNILKIDWILTFPLWLSDMSVFAETQELWITPALLQWFVNGERRGVLIFITL